LPTQGPEQPCPPWGRRHQGWPTSVGIQRSLLTVPEAPLGEPASLLLLPQLLPPQLCVSALRPPAVRAPPLAALEQLCPAEPSQRPFAILLAALALLTGPSPPRFVWLPPQTCVWLLHAWLQPLGVIVLRLLVWLVLPEHVACLPPLSALVRHPISPCLLQPCAPFPQLVSVRPQPPAALCLPPVGAGQLPS